jgi:hypothetical protein
MSDFYFRRAAVDEIKAHIDRRFGDLQRDMEWQAHQERYRLDRERYKAKAKRDTIIGASATVLVFACSVYANWDFVGILFG